MLWFIAYIIMILVSMVPLRQYRDTIPEGMRGRVIFFASLLWPLFWSLVIGIHIHRWLTE